MVRHQGPSFDSQTYRGSHLLLHFHESGNAIESTTKAPEDKEMKIFTELMMQLSSIEGFTAVEVDTIYDKLANNTTMIKAFLAKPLESKARWMRKELEK